MLLDSDLLYMVAGYPILLLSFARLREKTLYVKSALGLKKTLRSVQYAEPSGLDRVLGVPWTRRHEAAAATPNSLMFPSPPITL